MQKKCFEPGHASAKPRPSPMTQSVSGNVAVICELIILAVMTLFGATLDLRTATNREQALQLVLDNARLAAAREPVEWTDMPDLARAFFQQEVAQYLSQDAQYPLDFTVDESDAIPRPGSFMPRLVY